MGIELAKFITERCGSLKLSGNAHKVLTAMATTALDTPSKGKSERLYFAGAEPLAVALGYEDHKGKSAENAIGRAVRELVRKELIVPLVPKAGFGRRQRYRLRLSLSDCPTGLMGLLPYESDGAVSHRVDGAVPHQSDGAVPHRSDGQLPHQSDGAQDRERTEERKEAAGASTPGIAHQESSSSATEAPERLQDDDDADGRLGREIALRTGCASSEGTALVRWIRHRFNPRSVRSYIQVWSDDELLDKLEEMRSNPTGLAPDLLAREERAEAERAQRAAHEEQAQRQREQQKRASAANEQLRAHLSREPAFHELRAIVSELYEVRGDQMVTGAATGAVREELQVAIDPWAEPSEALPTQTETRAALHAVVERLGADLAAKQAASDMGTHSESARGSQGHSGGLADRRKAG